MTFEVVAVTVVTAFSSSGFCTLYLRSELLHVAAICLAWLIVDLTIRSVTKWNLDYRVRALTRLDAESRAVMERTVLIR